MIIRRGTEEDLESIGRLQSDAAVWPVRDYLHYELWVVEQQGTVSAFAAYRMLGDGEAELLNMAVAYGSRRQGLGRALLGATLRGRVFLEVRVSNVAAQGLYRAAGFFVTGLRMKYYSSPDEDALVMEWRE